MLLTVVVKVISDVADSCKGDHEISDVVDCCKDEQ